MENQEKNVSVPSAPQASPAPSLDPKGASRRRFARAGAGATGVLLTLQSQPAMATWGTACASPSGFVSAKTGTSLNPVRSCRNNEDPQYWQDNKKRWGSRAFANYQDRFDTHFACPRNYANLAKLSLYEVLARNTKAVQLADPSGISRLCIAAWLNARMDQQSAAVLTEDRVKDIWRQYAQTGEFYPDQARKTKPWTRYVIFAYLQTTFRTHGY